MKQTIKVREITKGCMPTIFEEGDWIDLITAEDVVLKAPHAHRIYKRKPEGNTESNRDVEFDNTIIKLGVAMEVPNGYEAILAPRSSTFKKYGIIQTNSFGVIDNTYKGDNDEWGLPVVATKNITIPKGTRICQFRIQLSQKATMWQKIKDLFTSGVELKEVKTLGNVDRKGFGEGTKNK